MKFENQLSFKAISKDESSNELVQSKAWQEMIELGGGICQNSTEKNVEPVEAKYNTAEKIKITVVKVPKKNNFVEASTDNLGFGPIAVIR